MKRLVIFSLLNLCLVIGLIAQNPDKKQNLPKENSKVTKEYDEKGNLIKFDSVYSYSWSGDSTMMKSFSPEDLSKMFGGGFNLFADSTFNNQSFFGDFDKMFANPFGQFGANQDSILQKHFGGKHDFQQFNDSSAFNFQNFDDMFGNFFESEKDSSSAKKQDKIAGKSQPKSMEEMMQMFQQQFKEMEKRHKQFFEEHQKQKDF